MSVRILGVRGFQNLGLRVCKDFRDQGFRGLEGLGFRVCKDFRV